MRRILLIVFIYSFMGYGQSVSNLISTNGPASKETISLLSYSDSVIFITRTSGLYKSTDHGNSWVKKEINLQSNDHLRLLIKHTNGDLFASSSGGGIYKSTDIGENWILTPSSQIGKARCIYSKANGFLFAGGETQNLYRSSNNGITWIPISSFTVDAIASSTSGTLVIVRNSVIYRSTDNGSTWTAGQSVSSSKHTLSSDQYDVLYYTGYRRWQRSSDQGINWQYISWSFDDFSDVVITPDSILFAAIGGPTGRIAKSDYYGNLVGIHGLFHYDVQKLALSQNKYLFAATNQAIYRNDFRTSNVFDRIDEDIKHRGVINFITIPALIVAVVDSVGIFRLLSNNNWQQQYTNHSFTKNPSAGFIGSFQLLGTKDRGLWKSSDNGTTWNQLDIFPYINSDIVSIKNVQNTLVFCATKNDGVYVTKNGAETWQKSDIGLPEVYSVEDMDITSNGLCYVSLTNDGVFFSLDSGQTWQSRSSGLPMNSKVSSISVRGNYLLAATPSMGIYHSSDFGMNWNRVTNGLPDTLSNPAVKYHSSGMGFVASGRIVYRSFDFGVNWFANYTVPQDANIISIAFDSYSVLYAGCDNGTVYRSQYTVIPVELSSFAASMIDTEVHLTWSTASELNNYGFEIGRSSDQVDWRTIGFREGKGTTTEQQNYSFTDDLFGVNSHKLYYRLKQIDYDGRFEYSNVLEVNVAPLNFALHQNYPNPFNPSTVISYQLPVAGDVALKVYDVLGREVATLVDEYKDAGYHEVEFKASSGIRDQASGICFYQLKAGSFFETKKMILIK